jgi:predicted  nucleic acid-binding Zn-ribbon protein
METDLKVCPFRQFGPCPGPTCMFWVERQGLCCIMVRLGGEAYAVGLEETVGGLEKELARLETVLGSRDAAIQELEGTLGGMVPRVEFIALDEVAKRQRERAERLEKELEDARHELEAIRAEGSEEARGSEESTERESK